MTQEPDSIGRGLLFPLRRGHDDFESGTGDTLLKSNVRKVIATRASGFNGRIAGEYRWRKNFGSWIHLLRHSNFSQVREDLAIVYLSMAIGRWEPRAEAQTDRSFVAPVASSTTQRIRLYFRRSEQASPSLHPQSYQDTYQEVTL